jgi:hypothetical protein
MFALAPLLLLVAPLRNLTEGRMATHMLLEFPLLIASGWFVAGALPVACPRLERMDILDAHGLLTVCFASCALAFWMIPTAVDLALLSEPVRWAKYLSLWLTGLLLSRSRRRLSVELEVFLAGMLAWMMATAGMIYQTLPQRLCVSYLHDDQRWTGVGLVAAAMLLGGAVLWQLAAKQRNGLDPATAP